MRFFHCLFVIFCLFGSAGLLSGCAAALLAGGAVGGYALAKDMEDGEFIDSPDSKAQAQKKAKQTDNENEGFLDSILKKPDTKSK